MSRWFVAIAKNGRAFRAIGELAERGFETYAPVEKTYRRQAGRRHKVEAPLLGRYFFVQIPEDNGFHQVSATPDVQGLLSNEAGPRQIQFHWITSLRDAESKGLFDKTARNLKSYAKGQKVMFSTGAFKGQIGELAKHRGHQRWEVFLRSVFGGGVGKMLAHEDEMEPVERVKERAA